MATVIVTRIRVFRVMSKFTAAEASTIFDALFRSVEVHLLANPKLHGALRILHSMRSDQYKCVCLPSLSLSW
jgi:hypothetical protein